MCAAVLSQFVTKGNQTLWPIAKKKYLHIFHYGSSLNPKRRKITGRCCDSTCQSSREGGAGPKREVSCRHRAIPPPLLLPLPPVCFWVGRYIAGDFHPVQLQLAVHCFAWCSFRQFRAVRPAARTNKIHPRESFPARYSNCRLILASDYITTL